MLAGDGRCTPGEIISHSKPSIKNATAKRKWMPAGKCGVISIMIAIAVALIMTSMSSGETAEPWLEKGAEAFANMHLEEAGEYFEKAVIADPRSAKAQLSLAVIYLFQYQNGISAQPDLPPDYVESLKNWKPGTPPPSPPRMPPLDPAKRHAQIAKQNSTNGAMAEEHLKRALSLEPRYEPALEYLAALYSWWRDTATESFVRLDDATQICKRLLEINPQHRFANYACGALEWQQGMRIVRTSTGFPRPLADEESRRSLHAKVAPLLADSARNLLRSLEFDSKNTGAMTYLMFVRGDQAYIAQTNEEAAQERAEADEWKRKVYEIIAARAKAAGQPWPPSPAASASITFTRVPQTGKPKIPSFPPDHSG